VKIPRIGVAARILATGLDKQKSMEIPEDIRKVGWYKLGVAPGSSRGSAVLVAHRDGRVQGRGAFYNIGALSLGDRIFVTNSLGKQLKYKVVARERIPKAVLPTEELFAVDGAPRLTLISCGGYYNKSRGGYQDNVVVTATPLPGTT
jgi:LPXTG-site transpeptidase (sortase) family protein